MSDALVLKSDQDTFTGQQMAALQALGVENASQGDLMLFLNQAQRTGLDPFSKQIYMIGRRQKVDGQWVMKQTIQVGIDGFRLIARRAADAAHERFSMDDVLWADQKGQWRDMWIWPTPPLAAKVTIYRGEGKFSAVAAYSEYVGTRYDKATGQQVPNSMWASKPALMLTKCAEALALRKAFPQELSGLYTSDEMQQADNQQQPLTPAPTGPATCGAQQAQRINTMLREAGVSNADEARVVFHALCGLSVDTAARLSVQDAENLLFDPPTTVNRVKYTLATLRRTEQSQSDQPAAEQQSGETVEATIVSEDQAQ